MVGWAERGGYDANGHGNSVPRFHITWGTGPGLVAPFERRVREGVARGLVQLKFRHRVTGLSRSAGAVDTVTGEILEPSTIERGQASSRDVTGAFELKAQAVIVTSGGIGGNHDLVRANWPERLGNPPEKMISGVPAHVDGRMLGIAEEAGADLINRDRMWHYTEGIQNWNPDLGRTTASASCPARPRSGWTPAASGCPVPLFPGFDTLGTLEHIMKTGYDYTWFVLDQKIIGKEFALSGSEQNPDLTGKSIKRRLQPGPRGRPRPGEGLHGPRRRLRRREGPRLPGPRHERAHRRNR